MRLHPHDYRYRRVNRLWSEYAQAVNPNVWFNLKDTPLEIVIKAREDLINQMMDELSKYYELEEDDGKD